jgi:hypothetical protein
MTSKMNCMGCDKDKEVSDFPSQNSTLCKRCKNARVVSTSSKGRSGSGGSWIGDIGEAIGDFIGDLLP